jgi:hypothetical protein
VTGLWVGSSMTPSHKPELPTPTRESQLPGAQPLLLRRLGAFVLEVLDRERVAALQNLDACAALLGDRLPVFAGTDAQRDHPSP